VDKLSSLSTSWPASTGVPASSSESDAKPENDDRVEMLAALLIAVLSFDPVRWLTTLETLDERSEDTDDNVLTGATRVADDDDDGVFEIGTFFSSKIQNEIFLIIGTFYSSQAFNPINVLSFN